MTPTARISPHPNVIPADAPRAETAFSQSIIGRVESHPVPLVRRSSGNALIVGGNWNNTSNAGLSYLNNNDDGGNSNNGTRLFYSLSHTIPVNSAPPLGETVKQNHIWLVPRAFRHGGSVRSGFKALGVVL